MKIRVNKRRWYFALVNFLLIFLALICAIVFWRIAVTLNSIDAADRWRGESEIGFAQLACFLPVDDPKAETDILQFRQTLEQKLTDASLDTGLYADAYSGTAGMTVKGENGSAAVKAIGVGGDFFLFHPLRLLSGSYISEDDLMQDRVVLDEVLAWQLFGGYDVAGMSVTINNKPYYIAGVVRREDDFATEKAYLDGAGMFIAYSAFEEVTGLDASITCYELVMPNMISGFARTIVDESFPVGTGDIVENSSRYSLGNLLQTAGDFGLRSMRNNGVIYPYWENAVRLTEDYLALLLVFMIVLLICPAITALVLVIRWIIRCYRRTKKWVPGRLEALSERKKEKNYAKVGK